MICSNCGGEYAETDLFCPFCKKENEIMAEKIKQAKYQQLVQEEREINFLMIRRTPRSTLLPHTTLFRSVSNVPTPKFVAGSARY